MSDQFSCSICGSEHCEGAMDDALCTVAARRQARQAVQAKLDADAAWIQKLIDRGRQLERADILKFLREKEDEWIQQARGIGRSAGFLADAITDGEHLSE